ncbi:MAG TPA: hypothetical protein VMV16_09255 [Solirubrobacteraceae bacterium]|nr:hypothetical protein [Solirubrobacteraceae bacterium]
MALCACLCAALSLALGLALPGVARAAGNPPGQPAPISAPPGVATLVPSMTKPPSGFHLTGEQVLATAKRNPVVIAELRKHPRLVGYVYTRGVGVWQVSWFTPLPPAGPKYQIEMLQLYVSDATGDVTQVWTGYQVAWTMARGYPGAFGRNINSLYVWLPLCVVFLLPFIPWRRRPTLWHLDLLMLLGFSASLAWFNNADLGLSVPSVYPFMLYLLVRMLLLACGRGRPREPLRIVIPTPVLVIALIFLIGFRVGLNIADSNVIDVGYAGVIGADKVVHGEQLYGHWPLQNSAGDTYGPVNYYAYVPFRLIWGWSGTWDSLPAAHAAAIAFDLLTMLGLFVLGWTVRGPTVGVVLAYLWAAFPFTSFVLMSNSNDALVALLIVASLLMLRFASMRGVVGALAGLTKFAPLGLAPLLWRGVGRMPGKRSTLTFVLCYALAIVVALLPVLLTGDWHWFWHDSISYQATRPAPFSIWGLWGGFKQSLHLPEHIVLGATVALGLAAPFWPRGERTLVEVAALGAAILIGLQMGITYWFYLYIVWFFPLVVIALVLAHPAIESTSWRRRRRRTPATAVPVLQ